MRARRGQLTSSARTTLANTGPGWKTNSSCPDGEDRGACDVARPDRAWWIAAGVPSAPARLRDVFPTPGTSSSSGALGGRQTRPGRHLGLALDEAVDRGGDPAGRLWNSAAPRSDGEALAGLPPDWPRPRSSRKAFRVYHRGRRRREFAHPLNSTASRTPGTQVEPRIRLQMRAFGPLVQALTKAGAVRARGGGSGCPGNHRQATAQLAPWKTYAESPRRGVVPTRHNPGWMRAHADRSSRDRRC
jgi:hypothetical protein